MLTRIKIKNFKVLDDVELDLGQTVVLIGPNNSGKTSALQAIALWNFGVAQWASRRGSDTAAEKRTGVSINRQDLIALPVPTAKLLWRNLKARPGMILIDVTVDGVTDGAPWTCGMEFDYGNEESFYCRPLRLQNGADSPHRMPLPDPARFVRVAFLPPMSGLAAVEPKLERGRVDVLIGEGQTAQVLRNLCHQIWQSSPERTQWKALVSDIHGLFGVTLREPKFVEHRGEITMAYEDASGVTLDISSSGRGLQQTLLLLAHLYANPGTVLLLDEPDAHLEILRQRQIYGLISDLAERLGSQVIAASHSEVVLNEAAEKDTLIAFVGKPHRIDNSSNRSQVRKALEEFGFEHYAAAAQNGWYLYLEGATDLAILQTFAKTMNHPAAKHLKCPAVYYFASNIQAANSHYWGLKEAYPALQGVAIRDRTDREFPKDFGPRSLEWKHREIENYFCAPGVLLRFARSQEPGDILALAEAPGSREEAMQRAIREVEAALKTLGKDPWSSDVKASDEVLDPIFQNYFKFLNLPMLFRKGDYHQLARFLDAAEIDHEIRNALDLIADVAASAAPTQVSERMVSLEELEEL